MLADKTIKKDESYATIYLMPLEEEIDKRIMQKWGLTRLLKWTMWYAPFHGETILLSAILNRPHRYNEKIISRVMNRVIEEDIPAEYKKKIQKKAKENYRDIFKKRDMGA